METANIQLTEKLFPHQKDIIDFALKAGRKAISIELNPEYFSDSLYYMKAQIYKMNVPTLFDVLE